MGNSIPHILIVDNDKSIQERVRSILASEGCVIDGVIGVQEGLKKLQRSTFDIVLVDLMIPGLKGIEILRSIHDIDSEIIKIVITGDATVETAVEAMKHGAYDYITKPLDPDELIAVVKRGWERRKVILETRSLLEERKSRLLEVATEKTRTKTIIRCMADGVLVTNRNGELVLWNPALLRMLKLKKEMESGKPLALYLRNRELEELISSVLSSGTQEYSMISRELQAGNAVLMANVAGVRDEEGNVLGAVTVLRDITTLKEIDRIKSEFVSMVAHELRAPLAAIEGHLDSYLKSCRKKDISEKNRQKLTRAKERASALSCLVNDLLDVCSIEAGRIARHKIPLSLKDVVVHVADLLHEEAKAKGVTVGIEIPEKLPEVEADHEDMIRVFTNIVNNAIKYNITGGSVKIKGEVTGGHLCIKVIDTGIGIASEDLLHIFDEFFRVKSEQTRYITGTGLGLSIVRKIVEAHFGRIEVDSTVKKGTEVRIFLPVVTTRNVT